MKALLKNVPTCLDYTYDPTLKIPVNVGLGFRWKDEEGHEFESVCSRGDLQNGRYRISRLSVSSYVGMSFGATHYYAKIKVYAPDCLDRTEGQLYASSGYGPERPAEYIRSISIEMTRDIKPGEVDFMGDALGNVGERTIRFDTEEEAVQAAIDTFRKRFDPGWVLVEEMTGKQIARNTMTKKSKKVNYTTDDRVRKQKGSGPLKVPKKKKNPKRSARRVKE